MLRIALRMLETNLRTLRTILRILEVLRIVETLRILETILRTLETKARDNNLLLILINKKANGNPLAFLLPIL